MYHQRVVGLTLPNVRARSPGIPVQIGLRVYSTGSSGAGSDCRCAAVASSHQTSPHPRPHLRGGLGRSGGHLVKLALVANNASMPLSRLKYVCTAAVCHWRAMWMSRSTRTAHTAATTWTFSREVRAEGTSRVIAPPRDDPCPVWRGAEDRSRLRCPLYHSHNYVRRAVRALRDRVPQDHGALLAVGEGAASRAVGQRWRLHLAVVVRSAALSVLD